MRTLDRRCSAGARALIFGVSVWTTACSGAPSEDDARATHPAWQLRFGGIGFQAPTAIAHAGESTVVGGVYQGGMTIGEVHLNAGGDLDGFVTALGPGGEVRWAHSLLGPGPDAVVALAEDGDGGVFLAGQAAPGSTLDDENLETTAKAGALFARLGAAGELLWARVAGGTSFQAATAVAVAPDGGVYFGGGFTGDFELDGVVVASSDAGGEAFVARFEANGVLGWVAVLGGTGEQHIAQLAAHADGSVVAAGVFDKALRMPGVEAFPHLLTNATPFVARLSAAGKGVWTTTELVPPELYDRPLQAGHGHGSGGIALGKVSLDVAPNGEIVTAVSFGDMFALHPQDFEAPDFSNIAVTRLADDGDVLWQHGVTGNDTLSLAGARATPTQTTFVTSWAGAVDVGGRTFESTAQLRVLLVDADEQGNISRIRHFGVAAASVSADVVTAADGAMLIAGRFTEPGVSSSDVFVARFDD